MNAEEQEYMDYLIHNRTQLTNQITRHLDEIELLQKKLDVAIKALEGIRNVWENNLNIFSYIARVANRKAKHALKEIALLGTSAKME